MPEPDDAAALPWSDQAVEQLHEALLHHALRLLQAAGNVAGKREVLRWIFTPAPMRAVTKDPGGRPVQVLLPQHCTPFSFERCCHVCRLDPERLREALACALRERGLAELLADTFAAERLRIHNLPLA